MDVFALQVGFSPTLWFGLLLFTIPAVLVVIGVIVLSNRATNDDHDEDDEELETLKRRVERLEAEQEQ
ncbi:hypothetical protein AUR64_13410 [Haloprofundus marisrubri]|uniref:Uncharacterized protein n=1 Tax=Haloprofundus marisrubri TaxID=1514971 RepID=A0A0W1R6G6_9EURY|nr:hypothetical protein [Haloprofundus marisrubri]KTG08812.1 hypothetical protein AUR64_13410 [Haloprofundus marisrubri]